MLRQLARGTSTTISANRMRAGARFFSESNTHSKLPPVTLNNTHIKSSMNSPTLFSQIPSIGLEDYKYRYYYAILQEGYTKSYNDFVNNLKDNLPCEQQAKNLLAHSGALVEELEEHLYRFLFVTKNPQILITTNPAEPVNEIQVKFTFQEYLELSKESKDLLTEEEAKVLFEQLESVNKFKP